MCKYQPKIQNELIIRGISFEIISDGDANSIITEIASPAVNYDIMKLEKYPRIAVYSPNRWEWALLQLGAALAGMVLVTVNPALRKRELRYVLQQSRSRALFYSGEYRGQSSAEIVAEPRFVRQPLRIDPEMPGDDLADLASKGVVHGCFS